MERSDFLEALFDACGDLRAYFLPEGRMWLTNIIATGYDSSASAAQKKGFEIDRIYELIVYFSLLQSLDDVVTLHYHAGGGNDGFRLPYGPAEKKNYAFFRFEYNGVVFDVCNGTALTEVNSGEPDENPDISLQEMESMDSLNSPGNPLAIWDAKYHGKHKLTKSDINQMYFWCNLFTLMSYAAGDVLESIFPDQFKVSGIVTNATKRPNYREPLLKAGFSVVLDYMGVGTGDPPIPSRSDHLARNAEGVAS